MAFEWGDPAQGTCRSRCTNCFVRWPQVYDAVSSFLVLLANTAYRVQGEFDRDAAAMKSSCDDVNSMLRRQDRRRWGRSERFFIP